MFESIFIITSILINLILFYLIIKYKKLLNRLNKQNFNRFLTEKSKLKILNFFKCIYQNKSTFSNYALTDFLDTFVLNLHAGLNTFKAFERASFSITDQNLQIYCKNILKKYYLGSSFLEALQTVRKAESNCDLQEAIESITLSLLLGTSLAENLAQLSNQLKAKANTELEKLASEASVKMIFPLVFFIFPVIFILLGSASIEDFIISFNN
ncbi:type II secretion system F family protein [Fluviispira sanaruensis]|uniref:Type II secretion system protein GspF domain-containing protein n=1 Tax=Fluviispira sanaruensis TaxID=2493639 RepID=A0A4P2VJT3_FLUSA|nr:type II secretion system F family protein [Fluviispira sanaruensis]BBH53493.1 hypothetical protein JCM31447_19370 [Fluviispira sanaruensis]